MICSKDSDDDDFDIDFNDEGSWTEYLSDFIINDDFWVNKYVSSGLTINMGSDWRMFELAQGERATDQAAKERTAVAPSQVCAKFSDLQERPAVVTSEPRITFSKL